MAKILPLWWAWQWRVMVAVVAANTLFGVLLLFLAPLLGLSKEALTIITDIFSLCVTIYASIYFLDYALRLDYGSFRVALMEKDLDIYKEAALK